MKSLPRAPQYSTYRQQFTTSSPVPSSSSAPFPVSRFATMPSATPSKWKNRDASRDVDREILPYLDSVPIQLLPLLPSSAEPSHPATPTAECSPQPHSTQSAAESIKPPITQPIPIPTPMLTPPPSLASSAETSPRPSSPVSSSVSSSLTSVSPQTPRHRMTFQIVPLLPVQEVAKPPPPPPVTAPPPPVRKFNMTFVPLLPPEELPQPPTPTQATAPDAVELTPQNETPPEHEDETSYPDDSDLDSLHSPSSDYVPFNGTRSYTSTPSLSSASDTDTESETPSVSSPGPSSPFDDDTLPGYFASSTTLNSDVSDSEALQSTADVGLNASFATRNTHNPSFPSLPPSANQTPRAPTPGNVADLSNLLRNKKLQLEALPSPALQPPSPFSLYPGEEDLTQEASDGVDPQIRYSAAAAKGSVSRRPFARWSSVLSQASDHSPGTSPIPTIEALRNYSLPLRRVDVQEDDRAVLSPSLSRRP